MLRVQASMADDPSSSEARPGSQNCLDMQHMGLACTKHRIGEGKGKGEISGGLYNQESDGTSSQRGEFRLGEEATGELEDTRMIAEGFTWDPSLEHLYIDESMAVLLVQSSFSGDGGFVLEALEELDLTGMQAGGELFFCEQTEENEQEKNNDMNLTAAMSDIDIFQWSPCSSSMGNSSYGFGDSPYSRYLSMSHASTKDSSDSLAGSMECDFTSSPSTSSSSSASTDLKMNLLLPAQPSSDQKSESLLPLPPFVPSIDVYSRNCPSLRSKRAVDWRINSVESLINSPTDPVGRFLRDMHISASQVVDLDLLPALEAAPKKPREKYGPRKHLTEAERLEQSRSRNREHAKSTRQRRKIFKQITEANKIKSPRSLMSSKSPLAVSNSTNSSNSAKSSNSSDDSEDE